MGILFVTFFGFHLITTCSNEETVLSMLRTSNSKFDIILTMTDMEGFNSQDIYIHIVL